MKKGLLDLTALLCLLN